jgi:hypothetical protein
LPSESLDRHALKGTGPAALERDSDSNGAPMNCRCGHPERAHVDGGRCRVPDCPCERFEPGDTLPAAHATDVARALLARSAEWTIRNSPTFSIVRTPTSSWSRNTGRAGQPEAFKR